MKQILRRIRANKLFSAIYLIGSALSIASAMLVVIYLYVKIADIYPENDRQHIYRIGDCAGTNYSNDGSSGGRSGIGLMYSYAEQLKQQLHMASTVSLVQTVIRPAYSNAIAVGGSRLFQIKMRPVDPEYFSVYDFEFVQGRCFTPEEFESGMPVAVISDRLASRMNLSEDDIIGHEIWLGLDLYRIIGVVREPSFIMSNSFGQAFIPFSVINNLKNTTVDDISLMTGSFVIHARVDSDEAGDSLVQAVKDWARLQGAMLSSPDKTAKLEIREIAPVSMIGINEDGHFSWTEILREYGYIVLILLIVPALNLGGLIGGQMESRLPEMGLRKSFGATKSRLLREVLVENMVLTGAGGLIGLLISFVLVWFWRDWMFFLDDAVMLDAPDSISLTITPEMLFAPAIILIAFLLCCVVNVLAAMLPAWWSLRHPIVESLSENK